ncbi:hypothetical protein GCM10022403_035330 [Streptomyces coacervatus]|uniref:Uncharacterized protein n=1 Tax=Streptomyces coacervatus TaxID=647381 RepID=A0ABP7HL49_9ACTN
MGKPIVTKALKETTERTASAKTIEETTANETGDSTKKKTITSTETATTAAPDTNGQTVALTHLEAPASSEREDGPPADRAHGAGAGRVRRHRAAPRTARRTRR